MKNRKWNKRATSGTVMLLVSAVLIIVGIFVSMHFQIPQLFWLFSVPAALLIVSGGIRLIRWFSPALYAHMSIKLTGEVGLTRSLRRLPSKVEAEVIGVTRNIRNAGDKMAYYVLCKWTDPKTGQEYTYTSRALQEYPGKEVIGKTVTVHLSKRDPGDYTVDLDPILPERLRQTKGNLHV